MFQIGFGWDDVVFLNRSVLDLEVVVLVVVDCNRPEVYHRLLDEGDAGDGYYTYHFGSTLSFACGKNNNIHFNLLSLLFTNESNGRRKHVLRISDLR